MPSTGMDCLLKKGGTTIAEITDISPSLTTGEAETTKLDAAGRMETWLGTKTGAEISMEMNFEPAAGAGTGHETDVLLEIINTADATSSPQTDTYTIVWSDSATTTWSFTAFWKAFTPSASRDGALTASGTLRVTGVIDWSV